MAVFRVRKNSDYTTISNHHLRDKNLSLKAKGLLTIMLSLPDSWDYSVNGLVALCKEGRGAVETALKELKEYGYLVVEKLTPSVSESGRYEYVYNVFEKPSRPQKQGGSFQPLEFQDLEIPQQLNTKESSTKELKKNNKKESRFKPPTVEEVRDHLKAKDYTDIDPEAFVYHYEANGWYRGKTKMKSWKAAIETWHRRNNPKPRSDQAKRNLDAVKAVLNGGQDTR